MAKHIFVSDLARNAVIGECIEALHIAFRKHQRSNEASGIVHAINVLETLKSPKDGGTP